MRIAAGVLGCLVAANVAVAQPNTPAQPEPLTPPSLTPVAAPLPSPHARSPRAAVTWAIVGTVVAAGLFTAGNEIAEHSEDLGTSFGGIFLALVGGGAMIPLPSLGHLYGDDRLLTTGLKIRAAGVVVAGYGLYNSFGAPDAPGRTPALIVAGVGGATILTGAIYDIATAGSAASRWNERNGATLSVVPAAINVPSHATIPGIGIGGRF
jgi:hypothetical protein